ncbi:DUF2840 domain-containing protein [Parvularcula dongshanensis]|uniref:DUF2840 domain-containing protein n=1 Tax=Parvularcula dongshanensis TaxID=1173995 RepID=A0A840I5N3_9PROT|nr:DUF2840 domain-containing protein [Parvularcula dongshanensis]MBB4659330.1 hypothetical protein [Parvularcula dongshanensis]
METYKGGKRQPDNPPLTALKGSANAAEPVVEAALSYAKNTAHDWLRFGVPVCKEPRGQHASVAFFAPGQTFAYVRWRGGEHGTADWQIYVCRAPITGAEGAGATQIVPGIEPGAEVLLYAPTPHYARRVLSLCKRIEAAGTRLETVPPLYWREAQAAMRCQKPVPTFVPKAWGSA